MGILAAIGGASVLLFSFAAGIVVDRVPRRPVMIAADLGRALLLASVPVFAFLHLLSITQLILVAACAGVLTVLFDVAYQSYLPSLIDSGELFEGNRLLSISAATAEILGPSLTGVLVKLLSAPSLSSSTRFPFLYPPPPHCLYAVPSPHLVSPHTTR